MQVFGSSLRATPGAFAATCASAAAHSVAKASLAAFSSIGGRDHLAGGSGFAELARR